MLRYRDGHRGDLQGEPAACPMGPWMAFGLKQECRSMPVVVPAGYQVLPGTCPARQPPGEVVALPCVRTIIHLSM